MKTWNADLHIHTCLSPCAELEMYPNNIIKRAMKKGLDMIAICDHNSIENAIHCHAAADGKNITVLPGMEITSIEEVHILAIFGDIDDAKHMQAVVYENLLGINDSDAIGLQVIVNSKNEVEAYCEKLLIGATSLTIDAIVDKIHEFGGLAIAAHVDKEMFSIISQLGFIPNNLPIDGIELSRHHAPDEWLKANPTLSSYPVFTNSDAHRISEIGSPRTRFIANDATFKELKSAIINDNGRGIV